MLIASDHYLHWCVQLHWNGMFLFTFTWVWTACTLFIYLFFLPFGIWLLYWDWVIKKLGIFFSLKSYWTESLTLLRLFFLFISTKTIIRDKAIPVAFMRLLIVNILQGNFIIIKTSRSMLGRKRTRALFSFLLPPICLLPPLTDCWFITGSI